MGISAVNFLINDAFYIALHHRKCSENFVNSVVKK